MSKLLQYLDQAVSHDPQSLEENIMDKRKSAAELQLLKFYFKRQEMCLTSYLLCCRLHGPPG